MTQIITKETAQKIDYLIQGMADGKFDEVAQKIEFVKKLTGDYNPPRYFQDMLERIDVLEEEKHELKSKLIDLETKHTNEMNELRSDLATIARAIQWLMKPDPLASELFEIENFLSKHGARKY